VLYYARRRGAEEERAQALQISQLFAEADYPRLSALDNLSLIRAPLLLHHGTADESVPHQWSLVLAERLKAAGAAFTFVSYEGENHNLSRRSFAAVLARDAAFFREHLSR
jgi:dipeptidyl aminopeptidase/acylaminoacyl peptidase